jgi:biopolymer transport protein ExbD
MRLPIPHNPPAQINVVSMIDVLFAILTFFIISSLSLSQTKGLSVNLPSAGNGSKVHEPTKIVVSLNDRNELLVNNQAASLENVALQIQQVINQESKSKESPSKANPVTIIINADEKSGHGRVVQIMDQVRRVPNIKIAIATRSR